MLFMWQFYSSYMVAIRKFCYNNVEISLEELKNYCEVAKESSSD